MAWSKRQESTTLELAEIELEGDLYYDAEQNALCLVEPETGEDEILTVNMLGAGYVAFPGEVFVRDYSEHSGLPAALVAVGVCEEVEKISTGPFGAGVSRMRVIETREQEERA